MTEHYCTCIFKANDGTYWINKELYGSLPYPSLYPWTGNIEHAFKRGFTPGRGDFVEEKYGFWVAIDRPTIEVPMVVDFTLDELEEAQKYIEESTR